jgi:ABC-type lipoprotein release transport system permease subunit
VQRGGARRASTAGYAAAIPVTISLTAFWAALAAVVTNGARASLSPPLRAARLAPAAALGAI